MTRCPSRSSGPAISPNIAFSANAGAGRRLGRRSARPSARANSRLVTGYGAVALIVKMDDVGLHLSERDDRLSQIVGYGLVRAMPALLRALSVIGTAAMLWVGGQIVLHGLDEYHIGGLGHALHDFAQRVGGGLPLGGAWEWLIGAAGAGVFGLLLGGLIVGMLHLLPGRKAH